jgi:hypothetical protein
VAPIYGNCLLNAFQNCKTNFSARTSAGIPNLQGNDGERTPASNSPKRDGAAVLPADGVTGSEPSSFESHGEAGRGKRNKENADDFESLLPSNTRAGTAYLRPDVKKEDGTKVDLVMLICGCTFEKKENIAKLSSGTIAAQDVANAAAEDAQHPRTA